ncbi:MAG TPA: hypothetical protein VGY97_08885, partial [Solirubrobacteraceae bacterium]|nr:hypothetical protein [Solirubrobacteraceae bacterium]
MPRVRLGATIRFGLSVAAAAVALAGCGGGGSTSSGSTSGGSTSSFNSAYVQVTGQYHLLGAQLATFINNLANHKLTTNGALVFALQ